MADTIATLALKTVLDGTDLTQGLNRQQQDVANFARGTKAAGVDIAGAFDSAKTKWSELFNNIGSGNLVGAFKNASSLLKDLIPSVPAITPRVNVTPAKADVQGLVDVAQRSGIQVETALGRVQAAAANVPKGFLGQLVADVAPFAAGAAIAAGAVAGIGVAARAVSKDMNELNKLSQRIGSSTQDTQVILRSFGRAGIEDAEHTLNRFFDRLGDVRRDLQGPTAQAFRNIGLDPSALLRQDPRQAIERTILALGRVGNVYDRAAISQAIFGKGFQDVQELIRQGQGGFDRAARFVELTGDSEATIRRATEAEARWREVGDSVSVVWGVVKKGFRSVMTDLSNDLSILAASAVEFFSNKPIIIDAKLRLDFERKLFRLGGSAANVFNPFHLDNPNRALDQIESLLPEGVAARRRAQQQLQAVMNLTPLDVIAQVQFRFPDIRPAIQGAVASARAAGLLGEQLVANRNVRGEAVAAGLLPPGAIASEVQALRPLLDMRRQLANSPAARFALPAFDFVARMIAGEQAQGRIRDLTAEWNRDAENVGRTQHQINLDLIERERILGHINDEQAVEARVAAQNLENRRQKQTLIDEAKRLNESTRTPLEAFNARNQELAANPFLNPQAVDRDVAARFRQLTAGLGTGPSSFGIQATDSRSREGVLAADDFRIRGQLQGGSPEERTARGIEALLRQEEIKAQADRETAEALRALERRGIVLQRANF